MKTLMIVLATCALTACAEEEHDDGSGNSGGSGGAVASDINFVSAADGGAEVMVCGGEACPDGSLACVGGQCWGPQISECFAVETFVDCDGYCEARGSFCNLGCWATSSVDFYADENCEPNLYLWSNQCDSPLEESPDPVAARCCCATPVD